MKIYFLNNYILNYTKNIELGALFYFFIYSAFYETYY